MSLNATRGTSHERRKQFEQAIQIHAEPGGVSVVVWENHRRTQLGFFDEVPDAERYREAVLDALVLAARKQAA